MNEGEQLRAFIDNQPKSKISIAKDLNMSKQNLFGLFKSKYLEQETKEKMESYFGKPIFTEGQGDKSSIVNLDQNDKDIVRSLSKGIENLSADKERTTALIERMFAFIEKQFNSDTTGKAPAEQPANKPPVDDQVFGDFELDKPYRKESKGSQKTKGI